MADSFHAIFAPFPHHRSFSNVIYIYIYIICNFLAPLILCAIRISPNFRQLVSSICATICWCIPTILVVGPGYEWKALSIQLSSDPRVIFTTAFAFTALFCCSFRFRTKGFKQGGHEGVVVFIFLKQTSQTKWTASNEWLFLHIKHVLKAHNSV